MFLEKQILYNRKKIESTMEVGGPGPPRRKLSVIRLKLEHLKIGLFFFMSSTSLKRAIAYGIIRYAHEPFVGGLQRMSNLRNFVAGFFKSSTSLKRVIACGIIRYAHEPFVGGLQRMSNLRNFVAGFFMSSTSLKRVDVYGIIRFAHEPFLGGLQWNFRK